MLKMRSRLGKLISIGIARAFFINITLLNASKLNVIHTHS